MTWELLNFVEIRAKAKAKIEATKLDQHSKDFLAASIDSLPPECNSIAISGYCQEIKNPRMPGRVTLNIQITITGNSF